MTARLWKPMPDKQALARHIEATFAYRVPEYWSTQVIARLNRRGAGPEGIPHPLTDRFCFRPGEVTCVAGANHSGKSTMTLQSAVHLSMRGINTCVLSLEERIDAVVSKLVLQALGCTHSRAVDERTVAEVLEALSEHLSLIDVTGRLEPAVALGLVRYTALEHGTHHFILDNLTQIVPVGGDHESVAQQFVGDLCSVARDTQVHVQLVAHTRKPQDSRLPTRHDVRGTGSITDQVDNVLMFMRDEANETKSLREGAARSNVDPDNVLMVDKQRATGSRAIVGLWHHECSQTFLTSSMEAPTRYLRGAAQ